MTDFTSYKLTQEEESRIHHLIEYKSEPKDIFEKGFLAHIFNQGPSPKTAKGIAWSIYAKELNEIIDTYADELDDFDPFDGESYWEHNHCPTPYDKGGYGDDYITLGSGDWGDSIDDSDAASWEDFNTPSREYESEEDDYSDQADQDYESDYYNESIDYFDHQTEWKIANSRQAQILQWLVCHGYFNIKGKRYHIHRGNTVVFNDGKRLDVIDFLLAEGISSNFRCFEYAVSHVGSGTKLESFWMTVIPNRLVSGIDTFKDVKPSDVERFDFLVDIKCVDKKPVPERPSDRQLDIVNWVSNSKHIKPFRNGQGFYIVKGIKIKLKSGNIIDIIDWLIEEGITKHRSVGEYNIKHDPPGNFQEKINFFKINSHNPK